MAKLTKEQMMEKLGALEVKLFDIVPQNEEETPRANLLDKVSQIVCGDAKATLDEMQSIFKEGSALLAVEAEVKKASKKKEEEVVEETEAEAEEETPVEEKPKKKVISKKKSDKKAKKKETSKVKDTEEDKEEPEVKFEFPKVLETEEDGDYKQVKIKSLADIKEDDIIACQWTEEDLKNWEYDQKGIGIGQPTKFEKDIDVLMVIDVWEDKLVYAESIGTHKMYYFLPEHIKGMDCNGMPWRVYRATK